MSMPRAEHVGTIAEFGIECSSMRFTTASTKAVDQPTSTLPPRPSAPESTHHPAPTPTSPNPIVVYVARRKYHDAHPLDDCGCPQGRDGEQEEAHALSPITVRLRRLPAAAERLVEVYDRDELIALGLCEGVLRRIEQL